MSKENDNTSNKSKAPAVPPRATVKVPSPIPRSGIKTFKEWVCENK